jgi:NAD(P)-dependent dehydrogenase (short-subunit alcohol dehydrogenase family)
MAASALIVGAGSGISAAVARRLARGGYSVALAARRPGALASLAEEIGAVAIACDAAVREDVDRLFAELRGRWQQLDVVLYNASYRIGGPLADLDPADVERSLAVCAYGGFLVAQQAARWMLQQGSGAIFFTGASASVKGLCSLGTVRYEQVRAAWAGAKHGARAFAAEHPRGALRHRRRGAPERPVRDGRSRRQRTRSRRDRPDLCRHSRPAAQCVDLGGRTAAMGRAVLKRRVH